MSMMQADPSQSTAYMGTVDTVQPITRGVADLDLKGYPHAFRLNLDKDWVIRSGDQVALGVTPDTDGVLNSYIYRNDTKGVTSEHEGLVDTSGMASLLIGAGTAVLIMSLAFNISALASGQTGTLNLLGMAGVMVGLGMLSVGVGGRKQNKQYRAILKAQREALKEITGEAKEEPAE